MKSDTRHIELLDRLRGLAILAVLVFHSFGMAYGHDALPWHGWWRDFSGQGSFLYFLPISMIGQAGVAIFFVVSGFCIHLSFQTQGRQWGRFFIRRFFRLYPAFFLALGLGILILSFSPGMDFYDRGLWAQLLSHVFLVHNFSATTMYGINAALWSLAVEAQLYLLYPLLLALAGRLGWFRALGILAGCEIVIRGLDGCAQTMGLADGALCQVSSWMADSPLGFWYSWALGALIAEAWLKKQPVPFANGSPVRWLALALACHFVRPLTGFQFLLFAVATAALMGRCLGGNGFKFKVPSLPLDALKWIGLWSYSIYLLHQPLLHIYAHLIVWGVPVEYRQPPVGLVFVLAIWVVIIPLSLLGYKVIELPGIALGKRIVQERSLEANAKPSKDQATARPVASATAGWASRPAFSLMTIALVLGMAGTIWIGYRFSYRGALAEGRTAWALATDSDPAARDGTRAVKLAEDACLQTQYHQPVLISTLAAAYAEAGRFGEAIGAAQMACSMASQSGDLSLLNKNQQLLKVYQQHQPYHDPPPVH